MRGSERAAGADLGDAENRGNAGLGTGGETHVRPADEGGEREDSRGRVRYGEERAAVRCA